MASTDELDVVFEARGDGLGAMCVALDKFDDLLLFFLLPPCLEGFQVFED